MPNFPAIELLVKCSYLTVFKMAAVRHLSFVVRVFGSPKKSILVVFITVQNLVGIDAGVSIMCKL